MTRPNARSALLLLAALAGCAGGAVDAQSSDSLTGAKKAKAYPEAVLVDLLSVPVSQLANPGKVSETELSGYCTGVLVTPKVVLTAGHCKTHGKGYRIKAPYAGKQIAFASTGLTLDYVDPGARPNPSEHDVALLLLDTPITLPDGATRPTLTNVGLPDGAEVIPLGRVHDGDRSDDDVYMHKKPLVVEDATPRGMPYCYDAEDVLEPGDSGGPVFLPGTHTIVADVSGRRTPWSFLARVDLVCRWLRATIDANGGGASFAGACGDADATAASPTVGDPSSSTTSACAHSVCESGDALADGCSSCVSAVCALDAYCCSTAWDAKCVSEIDPDACDTTCSP